MAKGAKLQSRQITNKLTKLIVHNQSHANCYLECHRSSEASHHSIAHESEGIIRGFWALGINTKLMAKEAKI